MPITPERPAGQVLGMDGAISSGSVTYCSCCRLHACHRAAHADYGTLRRVKSIHTLLKDAFAEPTDILRIASHSDSVPRP